jgi:5'-deoxy-5'-methylthioadenosine phosphorylase
MLTAIIGGSGLSRLDGLTITHREVTRTKYGEASGALTFGKMCGKTVVFLNRHGPGHTIPPHRVNYRANIIALKQVGVKQIIAVNAVGGIAGNLKPVGLVIPDQIIDYTYSRKHTYFGSEHGPVKHVDFTHPYTESLRKIILDVANSNEIPVTASGTYAATQGPRFETAAEIDRMERDGASIVGMTGMPESILAREQDLDYAMIAVVSNLAAGRSASEISVEEILAKLQQGMDNTRALLELVIPRL